MRPVYATSTTGAVEIKIHLALDENDTTLCWLPVESNASTGTKLSSRYWCVPCQVMRKVIQNREADVAVKQPHRETRTVQSS